MLMPWITMVRHDGETVFRLRPRTKWSEVIRLEVMVVTRAGRAREARRIIERLTRMGLVARDYTARQYRFCNDDLQRLQVVCAPHRRAICCNRMTGGSDA